MKLKCFQDSIDSSTIDVQGSSTIGGLGGFQNFVDRGVLI